MVLKSTILLLAALALGASSVPLRERGGQSNQQPMVPADPLSSSVSSSASAAQSSVSGQLKATPTVYSVIPIIGTAVSNEPHPSLRPSRSATPKCSDALAHPSVSASSLQSSLASMPTGQFTALPIAKRDNVVRAPAPTPLVRSEVMAEKRADGLYELFERDAEDLSDEDFWRYFGRNVISRDEITALLGREFLEVSDLD